MALFLEASPYLLLGLAVAGALHQFVPTGFVQRHLGGNSWGNIFKASLVGTPVPLCSCGVVPVGLGLTRDGASKATAVSFLIATPENGVESISLTYSFFGLPFTIVRLVFAMLVANLTGLMVALLGDKPEPVSTPSCCGGGCCGSSKPKEPTCCSPSKSSGFRFVTQEFVPAIAGWMIAGFVLSALMSVVLPPHLLGSLSPRWAVPLTGLIGVPLYVCASASTPIAYGLFAKGLSPGACLVFLLTGPATNAANFPVYLRSLGSRVTALYYGGIYVISVMLGLLLDLALPSSWILGGSGAAHSHMFVPSALDYACALVLALLLGYGVWWSKTGKATSCCSGELG